MLSSPQLCSMRPTEDLADMLDCICYTMYLWYDQDLHIYVSGTGIHSPKPDKMVLAVDNTPTMVNMSFFNVMVCFIQ